ncbi:amidase [Candidatus Bipolaricaulota bacterium]|nr:amidase [Candidatus Bipolaricaulota bacterium]
MDQWGVRQFQQAMSAGEITSVQIVEDCLKRIEQTDQGEEGIHSLIETNPNALEMARQLDTQRSQGHVHGPLHGIPLVIKANIDTADGMTTTAGSLALKGSIPEQDAFLVTRLRKAGAILLGKANLSEWANFRGKRSISGWSSLGGQTRNPHDLLRSPCGSSSGSAAAVAAGLCPISVGTETDGSIVCPAQTCGVVGIKPTIGLVSRSGIIPIAHSQDTAGPMARSVEDAALLLTVLAGADPRDEATQGTGLNHDLDFTQGLEQTALQGKRIGVVRAYFGAHPKIDRLIDARLGLLQELGAELVDPVAIETNGQWSESEFEVLLYEFKHDLNAYLRNLGPRAPVHSLSEIIAFNKQHADVVMPHFGQELMEMAQAKGPLTDQAYIDALHNNHRMTREAGIDATLNGHRLDALVAPTGGPAWLVDTVLGDVWVGGRCSSAPAVAGYPHVTVPAGLVEGLPIGLSFIGTAWQDAALIRYAYAFEQGLASRAS